jgi:hypothetical protein
MKMPKLGFGNSILQVLFILGLWVMTTMPAVAGITLTVSSTSVCGGGTVSVSASTDCESGGLNVSVSGGSYSSGTWTLQSASGNYTITATDACGNNKSVTVTVGQPSCDTPHAVTLDYTECEHTSPNNGDPCGVPVPGQTTGTGVIFDHLDDQACTVHAGSTCPGKCNLKKGTAYAATQKVYITPSCNSAATITYTTWYTLKYGCTDCDQTETGQVACSASGYGTLTYDHTNYRGLRKVSCY